MQFYVEGNSDNVYDRQNDDGTLGHYLFSTTSDQTVHVSAETYDPRVYAAGCKVNKVMAQLLVRKY